MNELSLLQGTIVFEGLDGAGTTTQKNLLSKYLKNKNIPYFSTFEPTDNMIGSLIRDILKHKHQTTSDALALLYSADRNDHLYNEEYGLVKQIEKGLIIIQDRYFYSSYAYQGVNTDWQFIKQINDFPHPEYLIYLNAPYTVCMDRIEKRGQSKELFEKSEFLKKVEHGYEKIFEALPPSVKFLRIDGTLSPEKIFDEVLVFLKDLI